MNKEWKNKKMVVMQAEGLLSTRRSGTQHRAGELVQFKNGCQIRNIYAHVEYQVDRYFDWDVTYQAYDARYLSCIHNAEGYVSSVQTNSAYTPAYYYYRKDHLGSNREVWRSSYLWANAVKPASTAQRMQYYPSGLPWKSNTGDYPETQPYKYENKEFIEKHGYDAYDSKARMYYPTIMRTQTMDPLAEKYYNISPYAWCGNNPVNITDPTGMEIKFTYEWEKDKDGNYVRYANGEYNLIGITMNVTGKVINISSNSKVNMTDATNRISSLIESSFKGKVNGVKFSTNVDLSVANSMDDVAESDHVFALTDKIESSSDGLVHGISSSIGGKVAFIDVDYFTGPLDTSIGNVGPGTAAHEFGHLAGLEHSNGLMMKEPGGILWMTSTEVRSNQLDNIHKAYKTGRLNQGPNWEYQRIMSPAAGGYIKRKMPFRGRAGYLIPYQ